MNAAFLRETAQGIYLSVKVQPRASQNRIQGMHGTELKIAVTAPPVDAAANVALVEFLAEHLGVSRSAVELVRGHTSRHKVFFITGLPSGEVLRLLFV